MRMVLAALLALAIAPGPSAAQPSAVARADSLYVRQHYVKREFRVPMRDGVRLHTVAYVPRDAGPSRRYPILLQRTPFSVAPYGEAYASSVGPDRFMMLDG